MFINSLFVGQRYKKGNVQRGVLRMTRKRSIENTGNNGRSPKRQNKTKKHWDSLKINILIKI